jgi:hypothetical protein
VEAAGRRSFARDSGNKTTIHEAKEFEPLFPINTNPLMAHDFGVYFVKTIALPRRPDSPGVLPSPGEIMETVPDLTE